MGSIYKHISTHKQTQNMENFAQTTIAEVLIFGFKANKERPTKVKCAKCDKVLTKAELTKRYLSKSRSNTTSSTKTKRSNTSSSLVRDRTDTKNSVYSMEYIFWS